MIIPTRISINNLNPPTLIGESLRRNSSCGVIYSTVESSLNFIEYDELTASRSGGKRGVPSVTKRMLAEQKHADWC